MAEESKKNRLLPWVASVSTLVTLSLTALNAYWSNEIRMLEGELKAQQMTLDEEKARLARYTFVQGLLDDLLSQKEAQKNLTINLVTLALSNDEAKKLFSGFASSENKQVESVGNIGLSSLKIRDLVSGMNDSIKSNRLTSVNTLIDEYKNNTVAITEAIKMLEPDSRDHLSASGRINVLVFLRNTSSDGWNETLVKRARNLIIELQKKSNEGFASVGPQTQEELKKLRVHLVHVENDF